LRFANFGPSAPAGLGNLDIARPVIPPAMGVNPFECPKCGSLMHNDLMNGGYRCFVCGNHKPFGHNVGGGGTGDPGRAPPKGGAQAGAFGAAAGSTGEPEAAGVGLSSPTLWQLASIICIVYRGTEITRLLERSGFKPRWNYLGTDWQFLHGVLEGQQQDFGPQGVIRILETVCSPRERLDRRDVRGKVNECLAPYGLEVGEDGEARGTERAQAPQDGNAALFDQRGYHGLVIEHAREKFLKSEYFSAVTECCKAFEELVQKKSRLGEGGTDLMGRAFGPDGALAVNFPGLKGETRENMRRGLMHLGMGIVANVRNPVSHELELRFRMGREDALDILGTISYLCRQVERTRRRRGSGRTPPKKSGEPGSKAGACGSLEPHGDDPGDTGLRAGARPASAQGRAGDPTAPRAGGRPGNPSADNGDDGTKRDLVEAERLLSIRPDDAGALVRKGAALCELGRHGEAATELGWAVRLAPGDAEAHCELGWALLSGERDADALRAFDEAVSLAPSHFDSHLGRGTVLHAMGLHTDALSAFDRAVEADPDDPEGHEGRASALVELGRHADAKEALARSIKIDPNSAVAHMDMALVLQEEHESGAALESCNRAIGLDAYLAEAYVLRAEIMLHLEQDDSAIGDCNHALSLDPANPGALYWRGAARFVTGKEDDALKDFELACKLDPNSAELHKARGDTLLALGRHDDALSAYDLVLSMDPNDPETRLNRVVVFLKRGKRADALSACRRLMKRHPDNSDVHLHMGLVYRELGRHDEALEEFRRAASLDPDGMYPKICIVSTLIELGHVDALLELATGEIEDRPGEAGPRWFRATCLCGLERHEEALSEINMAIGLNPGLVGCRLARGGILARLGREGEAMAQHSEALGMLDTIIARRPHDSIAHMMRGFALRALGRNDEARGAYARAARLEPGLEPLIRHIPRGML